METVELGDLVLVRFKDHYSEKNVSFSNYRPTGRTEQVTGKVVYFDDEVFVIAWWFEDAKDEGDIMEILQSTIKNVHLLEVGDELGLA